MYKILFVCTANIYRSRFSEEVYNHIAIKNNLSTRAFSAGLMVGSYKTRKIYKPALEELNRLNIKPIRAEEYSIHLDDVDLHNYNMIIIYLNHSILYFIFFKSKILSKYNL